MSETPELLAKSELDIIREEEGCLRERFGKDAVLIDFEEEYISVPFVNQYIVPEMQGYAADMIAYYVKSKGEEMDINRVVGIPNSGNYLATAVAERLNITLALSKKGEDLPGHWKEPLFISKEIPSFTTEKGSSFLFNGIKRGDRLLIVDDFLAFGNTGAAIIEELQKMGIDVKLLVEFVVKESQKGREKIKDKTGVDVYGALCTKRGLDLAPPQF